MGNAVATIVDYLGRKGKKNNDTDIWRIPRKKTPSLKSQVKNKEDRRQNIHYKIQFLKLCLKISSCYHRPGM